MPTLYTQSPTPADPSTKARLSILGTALVDALGGPPEFHKRFTYGRVTSMIPNNNFTTKVPAGVFTDDTSMTLSLARSLSTSSAHDGFDLIHQLDAYYNWKTHGVLSPIGKCFDIGNSIRRAVNIYGDSLSSSPPTTDVLEKIREGLGKEYYEGSKNVRVDGNGSLMRVLPVALAYWRDESVATQHARQSSTTTHPSAFCQEACGVWVGALVRIIQAADPAGPRAPLSKLDLLVYFATFPYADERLRDALALRVPPPSTASAAELEAHYVAHHPLLQLISIIPEGLPGSAGTLPPVKELPSSGYILHTFVAALFCFFSTTTFEDGALVAVNLGDDADTVGAVYAGIAGCWYASEKGSGEGFWSPKVEEWRNALVKRELVEEVAEQLVTRFIKESS